MDEELSNAEFQAFERKLKDMGLQGQWMADGLLESARGGPKPAGVPYIWHGAEYRAILQECCEVMASSFTARRAIVKPNPAFERMASTHTLAYSVQYVRPGEVAWAHRHTISALRFVIDGADKAYSVVNGEPLYMETNDLVLTPNWSWHDHHNDSEKDVMWLDVLDMGIALALNQTFYDTIGEASQPLYQDPGQYMAARTGIVRPAWEVPTTQAYPMRYAWKDVEPQLKRMAGLQGSPYDGIVLEYVNPMTGGPAFPTMGCWVQMLRPGEETKTHRHTSSSVFYVIRGQGTTVVGDEEFDWAEGDILVVPNWIDHRHINRSRENEAILFSVNDIPVLETLGYYRETPENSLHATPPAPIPGDVYRAQTGQH